VELSETPAKARDFEYILDDDGQDEEQDLGLLDWDQYARIRRRQVLGLTCPDLSGLVPMWWYKLPRQRRRVLLLAIPVALVAFFLILIAMGMSSTKSDDQGGASSHERRLCGWDSYMLPDVFVPEHYDVALDVAWHEVSQEFAVDGRVVIHLDPEQSTAKAGGPSRCMVVHVGQNVHLASSLEKGAAKAVGRDGEVVLGKKIGYNETSAQVILEFDEALGAGEVDSVELLFEYDLGKEMRGFYLSEYEDPGSGDTKMMASTQFEAADARRAFPCFDEPGMKATFDFVISVSKPSSSPFNEHFEVLFNTPLAENGYSSSGDGSSEVRQYTFERTPRMSTYLVAFVLGDLTSVTSNFGNGRVQVSVYATSHHAKEELNDALASAVKILPAYEKLFGIEFPLKKVDLVAIPSFEAGAMENWGLITYRETSLLLDSAQSSDSSVFGATATIAHELAHMWFGNLVTMEWWNDLFLNEGFAAYVEYIGTSVAKPEFDALDLFAPYTIQYALVSDSYDASHPTHVPKGDTLSNLEIDDLFDGITYDKGASLIRMLRAFLAKDPSHLLEDDPFITGLRHYLKKYSYSNADNNQFWSALEESTGYPVGQYMERWITEPNYPLLQLKWRGELDLELSQVPFQLSGVGTCEDDSQDAWWVPFGYTARDSVEAQWKVLDKCGGGADSILHLKDETDFVKLNHLQTGFFRVNYPEDLWRRLADNIASGALSSIDSSNLVDDAYALVEAGELTADVLLDLAKAVGQRSNSESSQEYDYQVWYAAVYALNAMHKKLEDSSCADTLKSFMSELVSRGASTYNLVTRLQSNSGSDIPGDFQTRLLMASLFSAGISFETSEIVNMALGFYDDQSQTKNFVAIDPNLRGNVYKVEARSGSEGYEAILDLYESASDAHERRRLFTALASVKESSLIEKSLRLVLTDSIDSMDVRTFLYRTSGSSTLGRQMTWDFLREKFDEIYIKVNGDDVASSRLAGVVNSVASGFTDVDRIEEVEAFCSKYDAWIPLSTLEKIKQKITSNSKWAERHSETVCKWLEDNPN